MFRRKNPAFAVVLFALLLGGAPARAQQDEKPRPFQEDSHSNRVSSESSDLARQNFERVAASAVEVKAVLLNDPGLLVELKRWVAKEATDSGQVVEDDELTDDAIFERLEHDVAFRSIATSLAQRYGYLLPTINPNSPVGKQQALAQEEQELIIKERARRLVQIEALEDSESLKPGGSENQEQSSQRAACDLQNLQNCAQSPSVRKSRGTYPLGPQGGSPYSEPNAPLSPGQSESSASTQMLRAGVTSEQTAAQGYPGSDLGLTLASNPVLGPQSELPGGMQGNTIDTLASVQGSNSLDNLPLMSPANAGDTTMNSGSEENRTMWVPGRRSSSPELAREIAPVTMVHKRNPYADIPSLYDMYVQAASRDREPERFGLEVFRNGTREPDAIPMDLPVGPDYVVGPGDGLSIDLWGGVSERLTRVVDREGRIALPEAGPLLVSGRTLGDVQQTVQQVLGTQFRDTSADVSLSRLRTIRIYVVGEVVAPGAYDISSLSTPLNALFAAGGVTQRGSLRKLQHYRGNQLIEQVDAYDLLLHGVGASPQRLENGDSLLVPSVGPEVTVTGMVRRPAIYELNGETSLADVLDLAGGILPAAALQHIEVQRLEAHEKRTMLNVDLSAKSDAGAIEKQLGAFKIQDGDKIHIFPIAPYNEDAVYLEGHVLRPGRYSYHPGMKFTDVVASYADLLPEPAGRYAEIVRLNPPDFRPSVESFDLSAAMKNPAAAPKLQPLDTIRIFSRFDFEQPPSVWVGGEVRAPGTYRTSGQAHLRDAIYLAGGILPDASLSSAQLFRTEPDGTLKILSVNLNEALKGDPLDNLILQPRDRLLIHRNSAFVDPPTVYVKGEVAKPGRYPLTTNMRVEDLIHVAGGIKRSADPETADLTSYSEGSGAQPAEQSVDVELSAALRGDPAANVSLHDGDVLTIRQRPGWNDIGAMVTLKGEVEHPGTYGIRPGERLSSVLERAGGFGPYAYPYGAVLMRQQVRDLEMRSQLELVQRLRAEEAGLKALPEVDKDQRDAKLNAVAQSETTITQLEEAPPIGRVVIHIRPELQEWRNSPADVPLSDGDVLVIPKKADYVMVSGSVFNGTAVSFRPGRSAKWYLSQAGGLTPLADKKAVFVIRADGSVIAAKNNSDGWFSGDPLNSVLRPGDSIVVPEKAPKIGGRNWAPLLQSAQVASSVALAVAYIHP